VSAPGTVPPPLRALVVDDEPLARLRLRMLLADHDDFVVVGECGDGTEALAAVRALRPDVVFLDVQMAEMDGVAAARALEAEGAAHPPPTVVFVTAFDQYAVRAFEVHALDYLLKPFDERRLAVTLARVRAQRAAVETREAHGRLLAALRDLAHAGPAGGAVAPAPAASALRVADLDLDLRARVVRRAGTLVALRPKEFDLLVALARRAGAVVSRRELLQEVWGYSEDTVSRTVDTHVAELRRKLAHAPGEPGYVATVARAGYRLDL
jgi:two-component system LytT family response regulator